MSTDIKASYTAADSIPLKVMLDKDLRASIEKDRRILPIHLQFIPTNRCNLSCSFCSCSERDRGLEMDLGLARKIIEKFKAVGTKSVTVTGGGEPLMHPKFAEIIDCFADNGIAIGLVTNGLLLHKVQPHIIDKLTWCRISNDDSRTMGVGYQERLSAVVRSCSGVDWAFSHVVSSAPDYAEIRRIIEFANEHQFTHVRLVADLFHPSDISMDRLRAELLRVGTKDEKVIYQGRKNAERGGPCYIGFLKPLVGADGRIYACCGVQYALAIPSRDLPQELCLGDALDIEAITASSGSDPLNGAQCVRCYYGSYNSLLGSMLKDLKHPEFL